MSKAKSDIFKLVIVAGLLMAAGLVTIRFGVGLPAILLSVSGLTALLWWFTRKPRPEGEQPSTAVSCCHYLGDHKDTGEIKGHSGDIHLRGK
jgi:hypothetical protein